MVQNTSVSLVQITNRSLQESVDKLADLADNIASIDVAVEKWLHNFWVKRAQNLYETGLAVQKLVPPKNKSYSDPAKTSRGDFPLYRPGFNALDMFEHQIRNKNPTSEYVIEKVNENLTTLYNSGIESMMCLNRIESYLSQRHRGKDLQAAYQHIELVRSSVDLALELERQYSKVTSILTQLEIDQSQSRRRIELNSGHPLDLSVDMPIYHAA